MASITATSRKSLKNGLITESAVSKSDYPMDACLESVNFQFDTIGKAKLRSGTTLLGNQLAASDILGLYSFINSDGTYNKLIAVNGTTAYYLSGSTWTAKRSGLTGTNARFSTFLDNVFMVNGADATSVWDGNPANSFVPTGNALGAPIGKYVENFRSRMWIAGNSTYPDRLYYSSVPSAETTPVIEWDTNVATGTWIDISPSDGENITALKRSRDCLLVFKHNHIYRVPSIDQVDPDPKFNVGTFSQESIVEAKNGVYFHSVSGFFCYADGSITEISRPIVDIVNAIDVSNYEKVCGYLENNGNNICWAVGDVTINGITYSNLVCRYTISSQTWTHYSYPTQFLCSSTYNDGSNIYMLVGDDNGNVLKTEIGNTDNGTPIYYSLIQAYDNIDGFDSTTKNISGICFYHSGGNGSQIAWRDSYDDKNDWTKKVLQLGRNDTGTLGAKIRGRKLQFRCYGVSSGEPFSYEGYEILFGDSSPVTFK